MNPLFSFSGLLASAARCAGVIYIVLIRFLNPERKDGDEYLVLRANVAGSTQDHGCGGVWVEPFTSCCCFFSIFTGIVSESCIDSDSAAPRETRLCRAAE